ncbi:MAG: D-alanyl-D-alanine carboxypeptidase family protein [Oscillospiraceae bacterium]|nr:D-alanyl-D-alanine carboxypeptidase family protein [Oscillospiraceae bacterium]
MRNGTITTLQANICDKYGFILRYPEKDQAVTGVMYEPWHWLFVGIKNAAAIKKSGLCLEAYLDSAGIIY